MASGLPLEEPFLASNIRDRQGGGRSAKVMRPHQHYVLSTSATPVFEWKTVTAPVTLFTNKREGLGGEKCVTVTEASCGNHGN